VVAVGGLVALGAASVSSSSARSGLETRDWNSNSTKTGANRAQAGWQGRGSMVERQPKQEMSATQERGVRMPRSSPWVFFIGEIKRVRIEVRDGGEEPLRRSAPAARVSWMAGPEDTGTMTV
jgi:hypothetical protein